MYEMVSPTISANMNLADISMNESDNRSEVIASGQKMMPRTISPRHIKNGNGNISMTVMIPTILLS